MVNPNVLGQMVATTWNDVSRDVADNISKLNSFGKYAKEKLKKWSDGGALIDERIVYSENDSFQRYRGYEQFTTPPQDIFTLAQYERKMCKISLTFSGQELRANSAKAKLIDLVKEGVTNLKTTMDNRFEEDIFSDGTADGGRQIGGLRRLVADNPATGTVGGIDRAAIAGNFWRNVSQTASLTAANIEENMRKMFSALRLNDSVPDVILADTELFEMFEASQLAYQQIVNKNKADGGYVSLMYKGVPVVLCGTAIGSRRMYFLNNKFIKFRPHKDLYFSVIGGDVAAKYGLKAAQHQDAFFEHRGLEANMTISSGRAHGVLIGS
jgi:hypothetical protein